MTVLNKWQALSAFMFVFAGCRQSEAPPRQTSAEIHLVMESDDGNAAARMRRLVTRVGGYIESGSLAADRSEVPEASYTFRIPAERVDAFRSEVSKIARLVKETHRVSDRTTERSVLLGAIARAEDEVRRLDAVEGPLTGQLAKERAASSEREAHARESLRSVSTEVKFAAVQVELSPESSALVRAPFGAVKDGALVGYSGAMNVLVGAAVLAAAISRTLLVLLGALMLLVATFRMIWRAAAFVTKRRRLASSGSTQ